MIIKTLRKRKGNFMNTILFDLDGTLLPLNNDDFEKVYFYALGKKFEFLGFDKETLIKAVWAGTIAMLKNHGTQFNEETFWTTFTSITKITKEKIEKEFEAFYLSDFILVKSITSPTPYAKKIIDILKSKGYTLVLATNPVFPKVATYQRVKWAGLEVSDFSYITTYENSSFCKPSLEYYQEVLEKINKKPGDCMMIGNNVTEDMVISKLGIKAFLLTENLINQENSDINRFRHGGWNELINLVDELPSLK